jgi:hypothetical protein
MLFVFQVMTKNVLAEREKNRMRLYVSEIQERKKGE